LNKERDQRFQTADEIVTELIKIQQELAGTPHISVRSARWFIPVTSFVVIGAVVGAYILLRSQRPEGPSRAINVSLKQLTFAGGVEEYPNWSPDGSMIAFSGEVGGFKKIFTKQLATGEETQLTKGASDDIQPSWTSDANTILFVRSHQANGKLEPGDIFGQYDGGDIWSIDVRSGKESKIIENAFNPSPRPDGQSIAFDASLSGARRIWIADNRGRNPRQITTDSSEAVAHIMPRWSPDGANIVFQNMERTTFDLKAVNVSSGKMTWITNDLFRDIGPVWAPSGKKIYFTSDRGGGLNIWRVTVSPEGIRSGQPEQITTGAGQDVDIAISPDGKNLAYSVLKLNADIWELPVAPNSGKALGEPQRVIATTREDSRGAWSHDGTMIAFNSDRTGEMNIWLYSLRDGAVRQLTKGSGGDFQPNWSPDGKTIVFFSSRSGNADIWSANVASGELIQLTKSSALEINPFYSPEGNLIAFQSDAGGRLEPWSMKSDGTDQHSMANMEVSGHFMRWLQGGKALVFRSPNPTQPGLWTVSPSGGEPSYLISPKGGAHTSFSPGFDLIMDVVGHKEMWVSSLTGKAPEKVFEFSDPEIRIDYPVWSPDGKWILFDWVKPQGGDIWLMENID
jgi:Tol biopolymer transport system component